MAPFWPESQKKETVLIAKDQTASKPVISAYTIWYAGVARSTVRLLGRRRPTSKLCLFLRVKVPITPMGDAHLLIYVYHKSRQMSRTFCKKYIGLRQTNMGVLLISTEQVQKTVETPYFVQKIAQNTECRMRQKTRGDGQNNCEFFMSCYYRLRRFERFPRQICVRQGNGCRAYFVYGQAR